MCKNRIRERERQRDESERNAYSRSNTRGKCESLRPFQSTNIPFSSLIYSRSFSAHSLSFNSIQTLKTCTSVTKTIVTPRSHEYDEEDDGKDIVCIVRRHRNKVPRISFERIERFFTPDHDASDARCNRSFFDFTRGK